MKPEDARNLVAARRCEQRAVGRERECAHGSWLGELSDELVALEVPEPRGSVGTGCADELAVLAEGDVVERNPCLDRSERTTRLEVPEADVAVGSDTREGDAVRGDGDAGCLSAVCSDPLLGPVDAPIPHACRAIGARAH